MDDSVELEIRMPVDIPSIVAVAQAEYRAYYETCIEMFHDKDSFVVELLILVNEGAEPVPEKHRMWRPDAIWKEGGAPTPAQFEPDPPAAFPPITGMHPSGVQLTVHPFVWNACEFHFESELSSWNAVDGWHAKWLDQNDTRPYNRYGLAGVIHWLREPIRKANRVCLLVDFGSATTESFDELVAALGESNVLELTVASSEYPARR